MSTLSTTEEVLTAARALIENPANWIKGTAKRGCAFCTLGAVWAVAGVCSPESDRAALVLSEALPPGSPTFSVDGVIAIYNDAPSTTHADILALFDRAIERAS